MLENLENSNIYTKIERLKKKNNGDIEIYKVVKYMIKTGHYDSNVFNYKNMEIDSDNINYFLRIKNKRCLSDLFSDYILYLDLDLVLLKSIYYDNTQSIEVLTSQFNCQIQDNYIMYIVKYNSYECFDILFDVLNPYNNMAMHYVVEKRDIKMFNLFIKKGYRVESDTIEYIETYQITDMIMKLKKHGYFV
jgi:hypothetical protein